MFGRALKAFHSLDPSSPSNLIPLHCSLNMDLLAFHQEFHTVGVLVSFLMLMNHSGVFYSHSSTFLFNVVSFVEPSLVPTSIIRCSFFKMFPSLQGVAAGFVWTSALPLVVPYFSLMCICHLTLFEISVLSFHTLKRNSEKNFFFSSKLLFQASWLFWELQPCLNLLIFYTIFDFRWGCWLPVRCSIFTLIERPCSKTIFWA